MIPLHDAVVSQTVELVIEPSLAWRYLPKDERLVKRKLTVCTI